MKFTLIFVNSLSGWDSTISAEYCYLLNAVSGAISSCDLPISAVFQWIFLGGNNNNGIMLIPKNGGLSIERSLTGGLRDKTQ